MKTLAKKVREQILLDQYGITRDGTQVRLNDPEKLPDEDSFIIYKSTGEKDSKTGLPIAVGIKYMR